MQQSNKLFERDHVRYFFHFAGLKGVALFFLFAICVLCPAQNTSSSESRELHIPSQAIGAALSAYSRASGIDLLYGTALPSGVVSNAVDGRMSSSEALSKLLAGTGLTFRFLDAHTVRLEAAPKAQAGVTQLGTLRVQGSEQGADHSQSNTTDSAFGDTGLGGNRTLNQVQSDRPYSTAGSVSYISREEMDRIPATAVGDIFKNTAGIISAGDHSASGLDINIRGLQGMDRINVLVDGTEQTNSQYVGYHGNTSSVYVDQDFISGVDISKGPDGGQYGAGAMGGVVNMRTLDATDVVPEGQKFGLVMKGDLASGTREPVVGSETVRMGNPAINGDAFHVSTAAGAIFNPFDAILAFSRRNTGNYTAGSTFGGDTSDYSTIAKGQEVLNSSQNSTSELIKLRPHLGNAHTLELGYSHYFDRHGELNEYILLYPTLLTTAQGKLAVTKTHSGTIRYAFLPDHSQLVHFHANVWSTRLQTQHGDQSQWTGTNYNLGYPTTSVGTEVFNSSVFHPKSLGTLSTKYGISFSQENATGSTPITTNTRTGVSYPGGDPSGKRYLGSIYGQAKDRYSRWLAIDLNLRVDRYHANGHNYYASLPKQDRSRVNGSAAVTVEPWEGIQFFGTWARGWRPPSLRETYWQFTTLLLPNSNLKPETSNDYELGVNVNRKNLFLDHDQAQLKFNFFSNVYGSYIVRNKPSGYSYYIWANLDRAEYRGVELEGKYKLPYVFAEGAFTKYTHINYCAVDSACSGSALSNDYYGGNYIPPSYAGSGTIGTNLFKDKLTGGLAANFWSKRTSLTGFVPGYIPPAAWPNSVILNAYMSYKATHHFNFGASAENLADRYYIDPLSVAILASPGRIVRLNATFKF